MLSSTPHQIENYNNTSLMPESDKSMVLTCYHKILDVLTKEFPGIITNKKLGGVPKSLMKWPGTLFFCRRKIDGVSGRSENGPFLQSLWSPNFWIETAQRLKFGDQAYAFEAAFLRKAFRRPLTLFRKRSGIKATLSINCQLFFIHNNTKIYSMDQLCLPMDLEEDIPPNHLVRLVNTVVNQLDDSIFDAAYAGGGRNSYHPKMLTKVIIYAYTQRIYSSRLIAKGIRKQMDV